MRETHIAVWILCPNSERSSGRVQKSLEPGWDYECQGLSAISDGRSHWSPLINPTVAKSHKVLSIL